MELELGALQELGCLDEITYQRESIDPPECEVLVRDQIT